MEKKTVYTKKRVVIVEAIVQAHIHSSFNNIIVSLT
ncbi:MAG: 30S ribosomal protein S11, partial [Verrucomicrobia bacterium]|nr:30S ribosomal protein S11 [Prolixibacteraceae bacterium]